MFWPINREPASTTPCAFAQAALSSDCRACQLRQTAAHDQIQSAARQNARRLPNSTAPSRICSNSTRNSTLGDMHKVRYVSMKPSHITKNYTALPHLAYYAARRTSEMSLSPEPECRVSLISWADERATGNIVLHSLRRQRRRLQAGFRSSASVQKRTWADPRGNHSIAQHLVEPNRDRTQRSNVSARRPADVVGWRSPACAAAACPMSGCSTTPDRAMFAPNSSATPCGLSVIVRAAT